jgi:hypothetical protein
VRSASCCTGSGVRMLGTIEFNDNPHTMTGKIGDVPSKRNLAAKVQPSRSQQPQRRPQHALRIGQLLPKGACAKISHSRSPPLLDTCTLHPHPKSRSHVRSAALQLAMARDFDLPARGR